MANLADPHQRLEFLLGWAVLLVVILFKVAEDELCSLKEAAGSLDFPDFAEPAAAEPLEQPVPLERAGQFFLADQTDRHLQGPPFMRGEDRERERNARARTGVTEFANYP